ncbi:MAG TPA: DUF255 domain-containing protein [Candidatus Acidoferrales bacterium]|nr:DUF255 domain-containing protein [Candidatus Acidoferrales bacterium]
MMRFSPIPNRAHLIHWREWGEEPFRDAQEQNKPVMLFLSAFWCRYCQRMDEGAFSDPENIALLNAYFIAVRAENAERPDVDARYNLNGWPTIIFMAPGGKLLAAVNYFESEPFGNLLARVYALHEQSKNESRREPIAEAPRETPAPKRADLSPASVLQVSERIMELADPLYGGYGRGQKFIHPEASDFLLARYEATKDPAYLNHVRLTLDTMRRRPIRDPDRGGYYRTCSRADWSRPHREKLLADQAGLVRNCLGAFRITGRPEYAEMASEIIDYMDTSLSDPKTGAFYGCEDFIRREGAEASGAANDLAIVDDCIYTDANAQAIVAYLEAAVILETPARKRRALAALDFLWHRCRSPQAGMFHYFDGAPHLPGLLNDQARMGTALVEAYRSTGEEKYLRRAQELAEFILRRLKSPHGGYYDLVPEESSGPMSPLISVEQNGAAASFLLALAEPLPEARYRDAAARALGAFPGDVSGYGIDAAEFAQALGEFLSRERP